MQCKQRKKYRYYSNSLNSVSIGRNENSVKLNSVNGGSNIDSENIVSVCYCSVLAPISISDGILYANFSEAKNCLICLLSMSVVCMCISIVNAYIFSNKYPCQKEKL